MTDKRDLIGKILEHRYEVEDLIGEGAMGYVYRGRQIRLKRPVAIKVPRPDLTANSEFMERFEREALAMAKCVHENIVTIFDVYVSRTPGEISYIAMELVNGPELDDFLRDHSAELKVGDVVDLFLQLARAIDAAHGAGVIHRDIKPSNIVVTQPKMIPKIMDFGIARGRLDQSLLTQTDVTIGTPAYMAPELIKGENAGPAADIYSFAQTIYYLLARAQPFTGTSTIALMYAKVHKSPTPLRDYNEHWPEALGDVLDQGLHKLPDKRPATALELARSIEKALSSFKDYPFSQFFVDPDAVETIVVPVVQPAAPQALPRWLIFAGVAVMAFIFLGAGYWAVQSLTGADGADVDLIVVNTQAQGGLDVSGDHADSIKSADPKRTDINNSSSEEIVAGVAAETSAPDAGMDSQEPIAPTQAEILAEPVREIISSPMTEPIASAPSIDSELARILNGTYDWGNDLSGPPRQLQLNLVDNVFLNQIRYSVFRGDMEELNRALIDVDAESRLRFHGLIEALLKHNRDIKLIYTRTSARVDSQYALIEFETGLTGLPRSGDSKNESVLIPKFKAKAVLKKSGRDWKLLTWPHFSNPM